MIFVITLVLGPLETNTYIVYSQTSKQAVIIDPADDSFEIESVIEKNNLKPVQIALTHGHGDHIGALEELRKKYNIPVAVHSEDAPFVTSADLNLSGSFGVPVNGKPPDILLKDGDKIQLSVDTFTVIHTPGHTPGGISLYVEGMVFTGDTLFKDSIGRYDLPGSDGSALSESLKKLLLLPDDTKVYPGHGPSTTIKREKKLNYLVKEMLNE